MYDYVFLMKILVNEKSILLWKKSSNKGPKTAGPKGLIN